MNSSKTNSTDSHYDCEINKSKNLDDLLRTSQDQIIHQISKTQSLIMQQLASIIFLTVCMMIFLAPFLLLNASSRKISYGVFIMCYFFMSFFIQIQRKAPHIKKSRRYLQKLKSQSKSSHQTFLQDITQYLSQLYELLFFDKKSHKLPCEYLEDPSGEHISKIEQNLMQSLKNDFRVLTFLGMIYLISAILTMILIENFHHWSQSIVMFACLCAGFYWLVNSSHKLEKTLKAWMQGFIKLRDWVSYIENLTTSTQQPLATNSDEKPSSICFCEHCGEPNQKYGTYCQHCGRKIEKI